MYSNRMEGIVLGKIGKQSEIIRNKQKANEEIYDLTKGELNVLPSKEIIEAIQESVLENSNLYTNSIGTIELRKNVAEFIKKESIFFKDYSYENIAMCVGAKQALFNTLSILLNKDDEVIVFSPYWTSFSEQIKLLEAKCIVVPLVEPFFDFDIEKIKDNIGTKTKAIIINSPNNPTGRIYTKEEFVSIFELAYQFNIYVIIDECYKDYCFPKKSYISPFHYWKGENNKIIMINSFSKNLALTGWRLGYICASKEIVEKVSIFQSHTSSNPSSLIQDAIRKILLTDTVNKFIDSNWVELNEKRNYVLNSFKYLKANKKIVNQGGFFFYINVSQILIKEDICIDEFCVNLLEHTGVSVVPGTAFGDSKGFRLSYCGDYKTLKVGIEKINLFFLDKKWI